MKEVHIFFGTDEQYFKYTSIIIYSIAVSAQTNKEIHKDKKIIFHVIAEPLSESLLKKIKEFSYLVNKTFPSEIVYHSADSEKFNKYPGWSETKNHSTYLRFLIPDFVNENVHKVLYLDSDMICNSDILDLFEVDLQGKTIGAIPDIIDEANLKGYLVRKNKKTFGKNFKYTYKDDAYFNAGVLLIDLDKWKEKKISEKACDVLDQFYTPLCDQDALNMVLFGDVCFLPAKWNFLWSSCFNKNSNMFFNLGMIEMELFDDAENIETMNEKETKLVAGKVIFVLNKSKENSDQFNIDDFLDHLKGHGIVKTLMNKKINKSKNKKGEKISFWDIIKDSVSDNQFLSEKLSKIEQVD